MTRGKKVPPKHIPAGQLDTKAVAKLTGLSESGLRGWRSRGQGPTSWTTPRGAVRYWAWDVAAWLAEHPRE